MDTINYEKLAQETKEVKENFEGSNQEVEKHVPAIKHVIQNNYTPSKEETHEEKEAPFPSYAKDSTPEVKEKVQYLVGRTFEKGLLEGVREARKQDPFILNLYHDTLAEKLHEEMKNKGLL